MSWRLPRQARSREIPFGSTSKQQRNKLRAWYIVPRKPSRHACCLVLLGTYQRFNTSASFVPPLQRCDCCPAPNPTLGRTQHGRYAFRCRNVGLKMRRCMLSTAFSPRAENLGQRGEVFAATRQFWQCVLCRRLLMTCVVVATYGVAAD